MHIQFSHMGNTFERISATNANDPETRERYDTLCRPSPSGRKISIGAYACFESHKSAWRRMLSQGEMQSIIMEDDIIFAEGFKNYLSEDWMPPGADIIKMETYLTRSHLENGRTSVVSNRKLRRLRSRHIGTACYAITAKTARSLLSFSETIQDPVDEIIFGDSSNFLDTHNIYQMIPAPTIQGDRLLGGDCQNWTATSIESRFLDKRIVGTKEGLFPRIFRRVREEVKARTRGTNYIVTPFG